MFSATCGLYNLKAVKTRDELAVGRHSKGIYVTKDDICDPSHDAIAYIVTWKKTMRKKAW
jgi:hypothetical protein